MDLVDRYLNAIRFWLPKDQKVDVIAELSEDIRLQVEERERELGRALGEEDLSALLKQRGSPFAVAGRFLPPRHLIGPQLYPIYEFVLKLAAGLYLIPAILVWAGLMIFVPSYRAAHSGASLFQGLGNLWTFVWTAALIMFAMITLGFAVGERVQGRSAARNNWNPRRLPAVRNVLKVSRASSLVDVVANLFFLAWWLGGFSFPIVLSLGGAIPPSALWLDFHTRFFAPIALFIAAGVVLALLNLIRPNLTPLRVAARAVIDAATPIIIFLTLGAHTGEISAAWTAMTGGAAEPAKLAAIRDWSLALTLGIIAVVCIFSCIRSVLRIIRWQALQSSRRGNGVA
jgi:hypothetical protein